MKAIRLIPALIVLLAVCLATTSLYPQSQSIPQYADTTAGFRQFLQDLLDATIKGDQQRIEALLRNTEVPDCGAWLHRMYKSDSADSWMSLCDPKTLHSSEQSMAELFAGFAKQKGEFAIRKVNDEIRGGERGFESGVVYGGKEPLEVYFALWKPVDQLKDSGGEPIGYFYFLDGGFRWDSLISFPKPKANAGSDKFVLPKLIAKVAPVYPADAKAQHISGTVRVFYVVGADGKVYNAHAISGEGLSEDPSRRKAAEDSVLKWQFEPLTVGGEPRVMTGLSADIVFSP
jgi:TonB family protein